MEIRLDKNGMPDNQNPEDPDPLSLLLLDVCKQMGVNPKYAAIAMGNVICAIIHERSHNYEDSFAGLELFFQGMRANMQEIFDEHGTGHNLNV